MSDWFKRYAFLLPLYLILVIVLPLLILAGLGGWYLFREGYGVYFASLLLSMSLAGGGIFWYWRRSLLSQDTSSEGVLDLPMPGDWAERDQKIWVRTEKKVEEIIQQGVIWQEIHKQGLELFLYVSQQYRPEDKHAGFGFSLPEFLAFTEEVSRRYRCSVIDYVPFVEQMEIANLLKMYDYKDRLLLVKKTYDWYRVARIFTPAGILSEIKGQVTGYLFNELSDQAQKKLYRLLLLEIGQVAIDLYRGAFCLPSKRQLDDFPEPPNLQPQRILFVGQIGVGKSSLINVLIKKTLAAVDVLESTDKIGAYPLEQEGLDMIHLIDTPGLNGSPEKQHQILVEMEKADLVVWILKANQSARAPDQELWKAFQQQCKDKPDVLAAPILMMMSHVDRLKPLAEWAPPYGSPEDDRAKAKTIKAAQEYNQELFALAEPPLPYSLHPQGEHYNLNSIRELLVKHYEHGINVQLNRLRKQDHKPELVDNLRRVWRSGITLLKN